MMTTTFNPGRRKHLEAAMQHVLTPAQHAAARELARAERACGAEPQPEDVYYWMRLNMPIATRRIENVLYPRD